jgi:hypothetical protein
MTIGTGQCAPSNNTGNVMPGVTYTGIATAKSTFCNTRHGNNCLSKAADEGIFGC